MLRKLLGAGLVALTLVFCALVPGRSFAQASLPNVVQTVAPSTQAKPIEHNVDISVPGTYTVTLVDQGASLTPPAPLTSVWLAITSGNAIVGTKLKAAGTTTFTATAAGTFIIHVVGVPGPVAGSGPVGVTVTDSANNQVVGFSDTLAVPSSALSNEGLLDSTFTVPTTTNYQVTLTDLQLPQALGTVTLAIVQEGGGLVTTLPGGPTSVSLQTGVTYRIFAVGQLASGVTAGVYAVNVSPVGGGVAVYGNTVPVGTATSLSSAALTAGNYTFTLADLSVPAALSQLGAAVMLHGLPVAQLMAAGSQTFAATADTYNVFGIGVPSTGTGSLSGTGSFSASLKSSAGAVALSVARAVTTVGGATSTYNFDTSLTSGGTYSLDMADFQYPATFVALSAVAVQGGVVLGTPPATLSLGSSVTNAPTTGTVSIAPAAGPVSLLVFAQPAAPTSSAGLFGIDLTASGSAAAFEATQGVGQLFSSQTATVVGNGSYQVTVTDLGWPTSFANFGVIVTRGTSRIGSIFGGGTFPFYAVPGVYNINFIAQPGPPANATDPVAGTYALSVATAPPLAPSVNLAPTPTSVTSGQSVTLTWTSQNATACTASGGWTGNQPVNGTTTISALTADTTFTLTCTAPGTTSAAKSVTVSVTAASKKGGGGVVGVEELAILLALALARARRTRSSHLSFGRHA